MPNAPTLVWSSESVTGVWLAPDPSRIVWVVEDGSMTVHVASVTTEPDGSLAINEAISLPDATGPTGARVGVASGGGRLGVLIADEEAQSASVWQFDSTGSTFGSSVDFESVGGNISGLESIEDGFAFASTREEFRLNRVVSMMASSSLVSSSGDSPSTPFVRSSGGDLLVT